MKAASATLGSAPANRIAVIRLSLRCFIYSLLGLVPVLGAPFAAVAMYVGWRARNAGADWNPAARYLGAARVMAPLGLLLTAAFLLACLAVATLGLDELCGSGST